MTMQSMFLATLVSMVAIQPALSATPTDAYIAAKQAAVLSLKHPEGVDPPPDDDRKEADAVKSLASLIREALGPIGVRDFPSHGESNIVSLADGEMESGHVDGLRATLRDGTSLLMTSIPLIQSWIKLTDNAWPGVEAALGSGAFYTQATASDAAVNIYGEVALKPKANQSVAKAFLVRKSQDNVAPLPPNGLIVMVISGDKVFVIDKPYKAAFPEIGACKAAWTAENRKIQPLFKAAAKAPDMTAAVESAQARVESADAAFRKCYGDAAPRQPFFASVVQQAQELAEKVE